MAKLEKKSSASGSPFNCGDRVDEDLVKETQCDINVAMLKSISSIVSLPKVNDRQGFPSLEVVLFLLVSFSVY